MTSLLPVRPWRRMLLSFVAGATLMSGGLAAVAPVAAPRPSSHAAAVAAEPERAKLFSHEVRRVFDALDGDPLRRLEKAGVPTPPVVVAAVESEILALSDRVLTAPERILRLLAQEGEILDARYRKAPHGVRQAVLAAHARRSDRLMADLQPILDRRLDDLLAAADVLRVAGDAARQGPDASQSRVKAAAVVAATRRTTPPADAAVLADLERRFAAYFDPVL